MNRPNTNILTSRKHIRVKISTNSSYYLVLYCTHTYYAAIILLLNGIEKKLPKYTLFSLVRFNRTIVFGRYFFSLFSAYLHVNCTVQYIYKPCSNAVKSSATVIKSKFNQYKMEQTSRSIRVQSLTSVPLG